jgi:hypothetical protein
VIPAFGRLRQKEQESKTSLGYTARPSLRTNKQNKTKTTQSKSMYEKTKTRLGNIRMGPWPGLS